MLLRSLVLLLACMNLGVAAWWAAHREPAPRAALMRICPIHPFRG